MLRKVHQKPVQVQLHTSPHARTDPEPKNTLINSFSFFSAVPHHLEDVGGAQPELDGLRLGGERKEEKAEKKNL